MLAVDPWGGMRDEYEGKGSATFRLKILKLRVLKARLIFLDRAVFIGDGLCLVRVRSYPVDPPGQPAIFFALGRTILDALRENLCSCVGKFPHPTVCRH